MTREERLQILGADVVARIHSEVSEMPPPTPELIRRLRPLFTDPASYTDRIIPQPAASPAKHSTAA